MTAKLFGVCIVLLSTICVFAENVIPKNSIYQIQSLWTTQEGKKILLKEFSGKLTIIGMIYTGCEHACPLTINQVQEIEKKMKAKGINDYQVVLATFDTIKDTPEHLKKYMSKRNLDSSRWTFLTTDNDEAVRELAIILGINYKKIDGGDFSHSNILTLLNSQGVIEFKLEGLNSDPEPFANMAATLIKK